MKYLDTWISAYKEKEIKGDFVNFYGVSAYTEEFKMHLMVALDALTEKSWSHRPDFRLGTCDDNVSVEIHSDEVVTGQLAHEKFDKSSLAGWTQVHKLSEYVVLTLKVQDAEPHRWGRRKWWTLYIDKAIWPPGLPPQTLWGSTSVTNVAQVRHEMNP